MKQDRAGAKPFAQASEHSRIPALSPPSAARNGRRQGDARRGRLCRAPAQGAQCQPYRRNNLPVAVLPQGTVRSVGGQELRFPMPLPRAEDFAQPAAARMATSSRGITSRFIFW